MSSIAPQLALISEKHGTAKPLCSRASRKMIALDNANGQISEPIISGNTAFHTWIYTSKDTREVIAKGCDIFQFENGLIALKDAYRKVTI